MIDLNNGGYMSKATEGIANIRGESFGSLSFIWADGPPGTSTCLYKGCFFNLDASHPGSKNIA